LAYVGIHGAVSSQEIRGRILKHVVVDDRVTVGTVKSWEARDGELILTIVLAEPVDSAQFANRDPWISDKIGNFSDGSPLGAKIEPRFSGAKEAGATIEVSVLDPNLPWQAGVLAANGPRFVGEVLTLSCL
jgi:hypothetical protein